MHAGLDDAGDERGGGEGAEGGAGAAQGAEEPAAEVPARSASPVEAAPAAPRRRLSGGGRAPWRRGVVPGARVFARGEPA